MLGSSILRSDFIDTHQYVFYFDCAFSWTSSTDFSLVYYDCGFHGYHYDCGFPGHLHHFVSTKNIMSVVFPSILINYFVNFQSQNLKIKKEKEILGVNFEEFR